MGLTATKLRWLCSETGLGKIKGRRSRKIQETGQSRRPRQTLSVGRRHAVSLNPFEAIVIGSGATGGVAAMTLAEAGLRVLVVEAGPDRSASEALGSEPGNSVRRAEGLISGRHRRQIQHPGYWKQNPSLYADERQYPYSTPEDQPFLWTQGRQVGGRSLTWGGITLRLSDYEFKGADHDGYGQNWPITHADLDPHYSALEQLFEVRGERDGLEQLPDGRMAPALPFMPEEERFRELLTRERGIPFIHSRGFEAHQRQQTSSWPKSSSNGSSLQRALATGRVEILSNSMAEYLDMGPAQERARSVVVVNRSTGERQRLDCNLVVVCASTIATLRLLLQSESQSHSRGFSDPSGQLGKGLMDHVSCCRFFSVPRAAGRAATQQSDPSSSLSGAGSFFLPFGNAPETCAGRPFLRGYGIWGGINRFDPPWWLKRNPDHRLGFLIGHGEVLSDARNQVCLSQRCDPLGVPMPHISCRWRANEQAMVEHMQSTIQDCINVAGGVTTSLADQVHLPLVKPLVAKALSAQEDAPAPGYYIHEVGGAPMGTSEDNSVVDRWNRLWRCPNVLVVDGACWPSSGWQSPTLTMMAITRRACLAAVTPEND